jgi:sugar lactone lactonase YvrE
MSPRLALLLLAALTPACAISPSDDRRNPALAGVAPILSEGAVEVVVELDRPPGNLGVGPDGRVYFTFHPEGEPPDVKLAVLEGGPGGARIRPFPDAAAQQTLVTPLGVRVDAKGRLWVVDHGAYGDSPAQLVAWDLATGKEVFRLVADDDVAESGSMWNDLEVDVARDVAYIADPSPFEFDPSIVVVDLKTKACRRVLLNDRSVDQDPDHVVVRGRFMKVYGLPLRVDVDTICLSPDGEFLYYGPLTARTLWRVPTAALRDEALDDDARAARVEAWCPKPTTDGGVCGPDGTLYLTAPELDGVARVPTNPMLAAIRAGAPSTTIAKAARPEAELLVRGKLLAWPDGLAMSPDGQWLYISCSQLHDIIGTDLEESIPAHRPYRILRVRLP